MAALRARRALLLGTALLGAPRPCAARRPQADSAVAPLSIVLGAAPPPAPEAAPSLVQAEERSETRLQGWMREAAQQAARRLVAVPEKMVTPEATAPKAEAAKTTPKAAANETGSQPTTEAPTEAPAGNATGESGLPVDLEAEIVELFEKTPLQEFTADHWHKMLDAKDVENPTLPATCDKQSYKFFIRQVTSCVRAKLGDKKGVVEHGGHYWCECTDHRMRPAPKGCEDVPLTPSPGVEITGCEAYMNVVHLLIWGYLVFEISHFLCFLVATYLCFKWHNAALQTEMTPFCGLKTICCCCCFTCFACCWPVDVRPSPPKP